MKKTLEVPPIQFRKTTLDNGLDVIVRQHPGLPLVAVNLWYHVGSKDEERRQRGFAHLFEHLMFEGSEHYPGDFFKPLQRLGAGINGSTSADRTNYYEDVPAAHVELALAMESDRMGFLLPALDEHKLRVQKDVVKNEYRQNYANRPYGQVGKLLAEALYPPAHPYSWLTIGVMEDVEAARLEDVEAFFRRYYVPSNASLCVVGDIDEAHAVDLAARYFGDLPPGAPALPPWTPPVGLGGDVHLRLRESVELDRVYDSWHTVPIFHDDDAPLALLADVLTRGRASRLYRSLVAEEGIAQTVSAYQQGRELAGSFLSVVTLRPGKPWERAREAVLAELGRIAAEGVTEAELERVRNGRLAGFVYALDNIGGFGGIADRLNAYNIYLGDPGRITSDFERFRRVTGDDLSRVARTYLTSRPRVAMEVLGQKPRQAVAVDRSTPPISAPPVAFRAPRPEILALECGTPLWVFPRRDLPIVAATLVLPAGAGTHGAERGGLASLTASMLDEGTKTRSAEALALAAESMGTSLFANCGWDGAYVGIQCLSPYLGESLELAADILLRPSFPETEWVRVRAQTLASLKSERDSADSRAHRALLKAIYEPDHPYRTTVDGSEETVGRLSLDEVARFHAGRYGPGQGAWIVSGDVDARTAARLLNGLLGDWRKPSSPPPDLPAVGSVARPRILLLDRPGAPQAVAHAGHVGVPRVHPDHADLLIFNQILGGLFTSRLNAKLREEKGFTYGIRSRFDFRRGSGPFAISASLQADRLAEAIDDIRGEFTAILDDRPPAEKELEDARRALVEGQARHFETPASLVSRYAELVLYGLDPDEHGRFAERLQAVTVSSMRAAAGRNLRPESLVFAVVADAQAVRPELEKFPWAEVIPVPQGAEFSEKHLV